MGEPKPADSSIAQTKRMHYLVCTKENKKLKRNFRYAQMHPHPHLLKKNSNMYSLHQETKKKE
jgi:hypothetical protein